MHTVPADLEVERQVFLGHLKEWRGSHMGQFVLIRGSNVVGFYPTLKEAFDQGTALYGLEPFFVQQVLPDNPVNVSFFGAHLLSS